MGRLALGEHERRVTELVAAHDAGSSLSVGAIAERFGVSQANAYVWRRRALEALRDRRARALQLRARSAVARVIAEGLQELGQHV